jgi:predicted transcriptional regulator
MQEATTIKVHQDTKTLLDQFREYRNESYDEVIRKVTIIAKQSETEPKLAKESMAAIERARTRIKSGKFITEDEARKRLGL